MAYHKQRLIGLDAKKREPNDSAIKSCYGSPICNSSVNDLNQHQQGVKRG